MVAYTGHRDGRVWILAPSLVNLMLGVNSIWPNRDTSSDGSIGDAAHAARVSEHNPCDIAVRGQRQWIVCAVDIDVDLDNDPLSSNAPEVSEVMAALFAHPSTRYVIYDRKIYQRKNMFRAEPYTGPSPHTGHIHVSVYSTESAVTETAGWFPNRAEVDDMPYSPEQLQQIIGDTPIRNKNGQVYALRDLLAAIDANVLMVGQGIAAVEQEIENVPDDLLRHKISAMDPKTGKATDITFEQGIGRASEATVVRQAAQVKSASEVGRFATIEDVKRKSAAVGTDTAALEALVADTLPDGTIRARDPRATP